MGDMHRWAVLFWATSLLFAAKVPTYSEEIAPLINKWCVECHRKGEAAPMAFTSYKEVRPWAKAIHERVVTRVMPPWHAQPGFGHFENERRLPDSEIDLVKAWVEAGAPEGDPAKIPPARHFADGWLIGKPDVVFELPQEVDVPASGVIPYQYYTVPTNFTQDTWIQASEIRPGNRSLVHHVIVFIQMPEDSKREKLSGYAPGEQPKEFPAGTAKLIPAGANLVFQMHYTTNGTAGKDRSYVGMKLASKPVQYRALTATALNTKFVIPAGAGNHEVTSSWEAKDDVRIIDLMPHMHLRGKDFEYTAVYPDGRREVILRVPKYDFNWQLLYRFKEPLRLPKSSRIECVAHFDNSVNNKYNPDPSQEVKWGPQTWEEMMIGWFDYTIDKPVDGPVSQ
jgi:hypothetical protein